MVCEQAVQRAGWTARVGHRLFGGMGPGRTGRRVETKVRMGCVGPVERRVLGGLVEWGGCARA